MKAIKKYLQETSGSHDKPHESVKCIIRDEKGKLLLLRRPMSYSGEANWTLPGGHLHKDEDKESALKREVYEETRLKIFSIQSLGTIKFTVPEKMDTHTCHMFTARVNNPTVYLNPEPQHNHQVGNEEHQTIHKPEHTEVKWLDRQWHLKDLPMLPELKRFILKRLKNTEK